MRGASLSLTVVLLVAAPLGCGDDGEGDAGGGAGGHEGGAGGASVGAGACDGAAMLPNPEDTSAKGPWPVGARTVAIEGRTVEIWYPAEPGSEAGASPKRYDVRDYLPDSEQGKISDDDAPVQTCDCYEGLSLDATHGPYPLVIFVHGTAGFRTQSLEITTHWASRGFVVVAADHPGLYLRDLLGSICGAGAVLQDLQADLEVVVSALEAPAADLSFLAGKVDTRRLAMSGHSAGGGAIDARGDVARVLIPMAAGGVAPGELLASTLVMGAVEDQVVDYTEQVEGFASSPSPKRLVGISPAGHLTFSSLCAIQNDAGDDIVTIGMANAVCGLELAGALFDCDASYVDAAVGWTIVNDATSAVLEEVLQCEPARAAWLDDLPSRYAEVADYQSAL